MTTLPVNLAAVYGGEIGAASFASFFLNLGLEPGPLFIAAVEGLRDGISSQIAVKMSIDSFLDKAFAVEGDYKVVANNSESDVGIEPGEVVRQVFKEANSQVYHYSHRMGRGGTLGAVGIAACLSANKFSIARVGTYSAYLFRGGSPVSIFADSEELPGTLSRYIGANAQILVDLSTLEVKDNDTLLMATCRISKDLLAKVAARISLNNSLDDKSCSVLACLSEAEPQLLERPLVISLLHLGRRVILLENPV